MKPYAEKFYKSMAWQKCRAGFIRSRGGLCEMCRKQGLIVPGVIVHHKTHLTPENINDPAVSLAYDNLMLLCRDCHAKIHGGTVLRYTIDEIGRVTAT